jgi:hypothetical protein
LAVGEEEHAVEAAARALQANSDSPVVAYLAAVGGPFIEPMLIRLVPRLKSAAAGASLQRTLVPFPNASRLLSAAISGMR